MVRNKVFVLVGIAFYINIFTHVHASYMEYSRVQCKHSNVQSTVLFQENKTD